MDERIAGFEPITLSEMDGVKLQDRADTKFIFAKGLLSEVLQEMQADYRLLEVEGTRGTKYRSLYFDTPDLRHYQDHHNRRTFRSKVRFREYVGSDLVFFEVKRKTGTGRTDKVRLRVSTIPDALTQEQQRFAMAASGRVEELMPTLWNHFTRYTFVHKTRPERLTMDIDLRFAVNGIERPLGEIVVAELKQERADRSSRFAHIMRERNIRPAGMSKYCIGMLLLEQPVKYNTFKEVLLKLERLRKAA
ncbi:MAG: polyphosphate polymerase domain-containing protein [Flavobacteriales bacterium]